VKNPIPVKRTCFWQAQSNDVTIASLHYRRLWKGRRDTEKQNCYSYDEHDAKISSSS